MFTANSMNCLNEALGLALPGNGTIVATHANRRKLFEQAAGRIVDMAYAYYRDGDASVLPRSIASRGAFENAMALDVAMGGSTNTVLHILAIAHEAGVDFGMEDIDAISRRVPCICKVAPSSDYHVEDVNRAGGILRILGELQAAGLVDGIGEARRRHDAGRSHRPLRHHRPDGDPGGARDLSERPRRRPQPGVRVPIGGLQGTRHRQGARLHPRRRPRLLSRMADWPC